MDLTINNSVDCKYVFESRIPRCKALNGLLFYDLINVLWVKLSYCIVVWRYAYPYTWVISDLKYSKMSIRYWFLCCIS